MRSSSRCGVMWILLTFALAGCGDDGQGAGNTSGSGLAGWGGVGASGASGGQGSGAGGQGAIGNAGGDGGMGNGGEGGEGPTSLDDLLERLRNDRDGTLLDESQGHGWPVLTDQGYVVVDADPALPAVAGDFDGWAGTPLTVDQGFSYAVVPLAPGDGYKLTDGTAYEADPWARAYNHDAFGELSLFQPVSAHLERHVVTGHPTLDPRTVRVWVPAGAATHVLYVHDGQNLFDPNAFFGGWKLQESAPPAMMLVGIDNTPDRMDEYTHVTDQVGGSAIGGDGDTYADYVQSVIRPLVVDHYGEPAKVGVMGSSLGGLISLHIAQRHAGEFDFAASLSGTLGWGSIGLSNETMIERYETAGNQGTAIYIDSGGGGTCIDSDGDGIEDDGTGSDNYCETLQLRDVAQLVGFTPDVDLWHWWEPGAAHNEAAWAARVWRPLAAFAAL